MADSEDRAIVPVGRVGTFGGDQLCGSCELLNLSSNKFLVGNAASALLRSRNIKSSYRLNSGLGKTSLGKISEIKQRCGKSECTLCHLVFEAVHRYSGQNVDEGSECFMVWEVDGRQAAKQVNFNTDIKGDRSTSLSNVSRRIKFWWTQKDGSEMDAYILFLATSDKVVLHADTKSNLRDPKQAVFLGQDFDVATPKTALFKSWLDTCEGQHQSESCHTDCVYDRARFHNLIQATWFGVIDVIRMRICQLPVDENTRMPSRYVALSYVWGEPPHDHRTLRENMSVRIQPGGIEENSLPCTIRKAIQLTRDIGERYIWIDSLCIVQDSTFSWELNAAEMDLVYGNAYLTICAADGQDDEAGLYALDVKTADTALKAELGNGLRLLVSRPSESIIRDSTWNQRGWTFQERILSRRCLVFSGGRVYFQCRSGNMSQDIGPDTSGQGLSMDWKASPLRTLDELEERPIWFYMTSVSLYTGRRLSYAKDILAAYKGVSRLIEPYIQGPISTFVYGLPPSHFDLALLWSPLSAQARREKEPKTNESDLPSWSWAGWISPVKYQQNMLDGCLIDTNEWLSKHTWIKWYIRNSAGDLRPIWDKNYMPKVEGVLSRWRGYATNSKSFRPFMLYEPWHIRSSYDMSTNVSVEGEMRVAPAREPELEPEFEWRRRSRHRTRYDGQYSSDPPTPYQDGDRAGAEVVIRSSDPHVAVSESAGTTETEDTELTRTETAGDEDAYGRQSRWSREQADSSLFGRSIPDNPFGVNVVSFDSNTQRGDRPILQFWTWRARFYVVHNEAATEASPPGDGLVRCDIADDNGDWCGHIVLNEVYIKSKESEPRMEFIALSDAKSFTKEECPNWAHYIPRSFDDIEWDLFFVMLIQWNKVSLTWERVGLGKVVQAAFHGSNWEEVLLG